MLYCVTLFRFSTKSDVVLNSDKPRSGGLSGLKHQRHPTALTGAAVPFAFALVRQDAECGLGGGLAQTGRTPCLQEGVTLLGRRDDCHVAIDKEDTGFSEGALKSMSTESGSPLPSFHKSPRVCFFP